MKWVVFFLRWILGMIGLGFILAMINPWPEAYIIGFVAGAVVTLALYIPEMLTLLEESWP